MSIIGDYNNDGIIKGFSNETNHRSYVKKASIVLAIILLIVSVVLFALNYRFLLTKTPISINEMLYDSNYTISDNELLSQPYESLIVDSSFGAYEKEEDSIDFSVAVTYTYYVAMLDDNSVIAVKVPGNKVQFLEAVSNDTLESDVLRSDYTVKLKGRMVELTNNDDLQYYKNALTDLGILDENGNNKNGGINVRYLCFDSTVSKKLWIFVIGAFVLGSFILLDTIVIIPARDKREKEKMEKIRLEEDNTIIFDDDERVINNRK